MIIFDVTILSSNITNEQQAISLWIENRDLTKRFNKKVDGIDQILNYNSFQFDHKEYILILETSIATKTAPL